MPQGSSTSVKVFYPRFKFEELLSLLKERIKALHVSLPMKKVMLFGSWSTGRATAFSDIDLLVIYEGRARDDAFKIVWRCLKVRGLELHVYSEEEAEKLRPTLESMTKDGILLFPSGKGDRHLFKIEDPIGP
ncbi:MAG: nucleotidyltransferase domain-containing protein [Thermodesulfobacteriota bacterium]